MVPRVLFLPLPLSRRVLLLASSASPPRVPIDSPAVQQTATRGCLWPELASGAVEKCDYCSSPAGAEVADEFGGASGACPADAQAD
jgi:hypothetical protein